MSAARFAITASSSSRKARSVFATPIAIANSNGMSVSGGGAAGVMRSGRALCFAK